MIHRVGIGLFPNLGFQRDVNNKSENRSSGAVTRQNKNDDLRNFHRNTHDLRKSIERLERALDKAKQKEATPEETPSTSQRNASRRAASSSSNESTFTVSLLQRRAVQQSYSKNKSSERVAENKLPDELIALSNTYDEEEIPEPEENPTPEEGTPEDNSLPEENFAPEEGSPEENPAPEENVPEENVAPEEGVPEENFTPEEGIEEGIPEENPAPEDTIPEENLAPEEGVPEDSWLPEEGVPEESPAPEDAIPEENLAPEDGVPEETPPEEEIPEENPEDGIPEEYPTPEDGVPEETPPPEDDDPELSDIEKPRHSHRHRAERKDKVTVPDDKEELAAIRNLLNKERVQLYETMKAEPKVSAPTRVEEMSSAEDLDDAMYEFAQGMHSLFNDTRMQAMPMHKEERKLKSDIRGLFKKSGVDKDLKEPASWKKLFDKKSPEDAKGLLHELSERLKKTEKEARQRLGDSGTLIKTSA